MTELETSARQASSSAGQYYFSLPLSDIVCCTFLPAFRTHRATQIFSNTFWKQLFSGISASFTKHFHDFSLANVYSGTFFCG